MGPKSQSRIFESGKILVQLRMCLKVDVIISAGPLLSCNFFGEHLASFLYAALLLKSLKSYHHSILIFTILTCHRSVSTF